MSILHQHRGLILFGSSAGMTDEYIRQIIDNASSAPDGMWHTQRYTFQAVRDDDGTVYLWRACGHRPESAAWEKIAALCPDGTLMRCVG